jgi:hypothetical protein
MLFFRDLQKEKEQLSIECKQVIEDNNALDNRKQEEEDKRIEVNKLINNQKNTVFLKEKDYNDLQKQLELEKEKETVLLADKLILFLIKVFKGSINKRRRNFCWFVYKLSEQHSNLVFGIHSLKRKQNTII